jgi:hypothetical protein
VKRLSLVTVLAVLLAVCLLTAAGPALAGNAAVSLHGTFLGVLDDGVLHPDQPMPGDLTTVGWTFYALWLTATGPEGARFQTYIVQSETTIERPSGNNGHTGFIAYTTADPSLTWVPGASWQDNLAGLPAGSLMWVGTVTGETHAYHNHVWVNRLEGQNGNAGLTATVRWVVNDYTNANGSAVIGW